MDNYRAEGEGTPSSRREREHDAHRQEIISVAESVFSAHGYDGTTIEMVAKQAEFSVGSIYNFFKGKKDLFHQVFLSVSNRRTERIHEATAPLLDRPWEALRALVHAWKDYYVEHREFLRTAFGAITAGGSRNRPETAPPAEFIECFHAYYGEVEAVMEVLVRDSAARPFTAKEAMNISMGVVREILTRSGRDPATGLPRAVGDDAADRAYETLCKIFRKETP